VAAFQSVTSVVLRILASRVVRVTFVVASVTLGVVAVVTEWDDIRPALARLSLPLLGTAFVATLGGLMASMVMWRLLLAGLGSALPYRVAARVLFVSQLGKYLPGSVWPALAQMELGRDHGVPRRRSMTVFALLMLFSLTSGLVVASGTLPLAATEETRRFWWALLLTPVLLAIVHPRVLNPLLDWLLRLVRRPQLERPVTWVMSAQATLVGVIQWLCYGLHTWLLAVALGADPLPTLPLAVGGFALAWCVGYLVVITPAGLGVREVALVAALSPVLAPADALVLAIASRAIVTVADLVVAGSSAVSMRAARADEPSTS
jgi:hypothetical protein